MDDMTRSILEFYLGLTTNTIAMFIFAIALIYALRTVLLANKINRSFYMLFAMSFLEICTHFFTIVAQYHGFWGSQQLGVFMYSFVYTVNCFYLIAWIFFLNRRLREKYSVDSTYWKRTFFLSVPVVLLLVISIINMFTPVIFSYENFDYERMPAYTLTWLIPVVYLLYGLYLFYRSSSKRKVYLEVPFVELIIPVVIAHFVETYTEIACVVPLGNVIVLLIMLLNSTQHNLAFDKLTGLYTKAEMLEYLESLGNLPKQKAKIEGILLDLNKFKAINDTYGHLVGDEALRDFGRIVCASLPYSAAGFRYAGDEFVILLNAATKGEAEQLVEKINANLASLNASGSRKYELSASYGIGVWEPSESIGEFIEKLDVRMYAQKQAYRATH